MTRAVAVVGPTASGKARLGVTLAERLGWPVLVCDSVKVYRGLDVGSAKPPPDLRARARHELLDLVDPDQEFSAGDYARAAWAHLGRGPGVFVGGTGFYLRAVMFRPSGADAGDLPRDDPRRRAFEAHWLAREDERPGAIHGALSALDPPTAAEIHPNNRTRALRALWLCELHGRPVSAVRAQDPPRRRLETLILSLDPGKEAGDAAIAARVDRMLEAGWLAEVEKLRAAGYDGRHRAMTSLGYKQLLDVVEGRTDLSEARRDIVAATRRYARRQRLYFRNQLPGPRIELRSAQDLPWDRVQAFTQGVWP